MNALTTHQLRSSLPAPLPNKAACAIAAFATALDQRGLGYEIPAEKAPNSEQRAWLENRRDALRLALTLATEQEITAELVALFACLAHRSADEAEAGAILGVYAADLSGLPSVAVRLSFADFRQGKAGDGKWVPTQAQIRQRAEQHVSGVRAELGQIEKVLAAKVVRIEVNEQYKAQVIAHVNETIEILKANSDRKHEERRAPTPKEAESWLEAEEKAPWCPPLSPELARSLGLKPGEAA